MADYEIEHVFDEKDLGVIFDSNMYFEEHIGLGGSGRLTDAMVDKTQNYYGIAIRRNTGKDNDTMKKAIWAAFFHVTSSKVA